MGYRSFRIAPSDEFPDSTFVEDCAVIAGKTVVWTRPGADSRRHEVGLLQEQMPFAASYREITEPGTLDGGDICEMAGHFVIGISERTNEDGARQLAAILAELGFSSSTIDIRGNRELLHLKTGLSYLDGVVVCNPEISAHFKDPIVVDPAEGYAANGAHFGHRRVLIPSGAPKLSRTLRDLGFDVKEPEMSEFQKMDGGISCLSLRFS